MSNDVGPLTHRQRDILTRLASGQRQSEIAAEWGVSRPCVGNEVIRAVRKMGVKTSWQAVAVWSQYETLQGVRSTIAISLVPSPYGPEDEHVNAVLGELAQDFRAQAQALLPK
jgi:DNA-binding CsgD family transcriptional regulator